MSEHELTHRKLGLGAVILLLLAPAIFLLAWGVQHAPDSAQARQLEARANECKGAQP